MGSRTFGVMYGCKTDLDWNSGIFPTTENTDPVLSQFQGDRPTWEYGEEFCLIGFWIAVGGGGLDGAPVLTSYPLARPQELYGDYIDRAKERWALFATWCREQGHPLGEPELFLMETESY